MSFVLDSRVPWEVLKIGRHSGFTLQFTDQLLTVGEEDGAHAIPQQLKDEYVTLTNEVQRNVVLRHLVSSVSEAEFIRYNFQDLWHGLVAITIGLLVAVGTFSGYPSSSRPYFYLFLVLLAFMFGAYGTVAFRRKRAPKSEIAWHQRWSLYYELCHVFMTVLCAVYFIPTYLVKEYCFGLSPYEKWNACLNAFSMEANTATAAAIMFLLLAPRVFTLAILCPASIFLGFGLGKMETDPNMEPPELFVSALLLYFSIVVFVIFYAHSKEKLTRKKFLALIESEVIGRRISNVHDFSSEVLAAVMPLTTARRLVAGINSADVKESATVVCCSLLGMTKWCSVHGAGEITDMMEHVFVPLDELIESYSMVKIQSLGDTYVCVAGLTTDDPKHAQRGFVVALNVPRQIRLVEYGELKWRIAVDTGKLSGKPLGSTLAYTVCGTGFENCYKLIRQEQLPGVFIGPGTRALVHESPFGVLQDGNFMTQGKGGEVTNEEGEYFLQEIANTTPTTSTSATTRTEHELCNEFLDNRDPSESPPGLSHIEAGQMHTLVYGSSILAKGEELDEKDKKKKKRPCIKFSCPTGWTFADPDHERRYQEFTTLLHSHKDRVPGFLGLLMMFWMSSLTLFVILLADDKNIDLVSCVLFSAAALAALGGIFLCHSQPEEERWRKNWISLGAMLTHQVLYCIATLLAPFPSLITNGIHYWLVSGTAGVILWYDFQCQPHTHAMILILTVTVPILAQIQWRYANLRTKDVYFQSLFMTVMQLCSAFPIIFRWDIFLRYFFVSQHLRDEEARELHSMQVAQDRLLSIVHPAWISDATKQLVGTWASARGGGGGGGEPVFCFSTSLQDMPMMLVSLSPTNPNTPMNLEFLEKAHTLLDYVLSTYPQFLKTKCVGGRVLICSQTLADNPSSFVRFATELEYLMRADHRNIQGDCAVVLAHGAIVASIIGRKGITFELFGDTVQTAILLLDACAPWSVIGTERFIFTLRVEIEEEERRRIFHGSTSTSTAGGAASAHQNHHHTTVVGPREDEFRERIIIGNNQVWSMRGRGKIVVSTVKSVPLGGGGDTTTSTTTSTTSWSVASGVTAGSPDSGDRQKHIPDHVFVAKEAKGQVSSTTNTTSSSGTASGMNTIQVEVRRPSQGQQQTQELPPPGQQNMTSE